MALFIPNLKALLKAAAAEAGPVPLFVNVTSTTAFPQVFDPVTTVDVTVKFGAPCCKINSPGAVGAGVWQEEPLQPQFVS